MHRYFSSINHFIATLCLLTAIAGHTGCTASASGDTPDGSPDGSPAGSDSTTGFATDGASTETASAPKALFEVDVSLASDHDPNAPGTVGIVNWSVDGVSVEKASIRFGLDTSYGFVAPVIRRSRATARCCSA